MVFDLVTCVLVIVSAFVVQRKFGLLAWYNPFVLFWWYSLVFLGIGLLYRALYSWYIDITPLTFYLIWTGMGATLVGALVANWFFGDGFRATGKKALPIDLDSPEARKWLAVLFIAAGVGAAIQYYVMIGAIPFLASDADNFRIEARMGRGWVVLLSLSLLRYGVVQYAAAAAASHSGSVKMMAVTIAAALFAIGMGDRAPGLEICFFGLLTYMLFRGRTPSVRQMATFAATGLSIMAVLGIVRQGLEMNGLMVALQMAWRPFVNIQNLQWICDYFPSGHAFLLGQGYWIDLSVLLPGYSPNFGTWFKEQSGLVFGGGSVTVSYLGEIFANFGAWGIPLIACAYGFMLTSINSVLTRNLRGNRLILLILLAISLKGIVSSGVVSVLLYDTLPLLTIHILFQWTLRTIQLVTRPMPGIAAGRP